MDEDQVALAYDSMKAYIRRAPILQQRLRVLRGEIVNEGAGSVVTVLVADAASSWDLRPSLLVCDVAQPVEDAGARGVLLVAVVKPRQDRRRADARLSDGRPSQGPIPKVPLPKVLADAKHGSLNELSPVLSPPNAFLKITSPSLSRPIVGLSSQPNLGCRTADSSVVVEFKEPASWAD